MQAVMSSYGGAIEHHNGENIIIIIIHLFYIAQFLSQLKALQIKRQSNLLIKKNL